MSLTRPSLRLTYEGAQTLLAAAVAYAKEMGVPQCIACLLYTSPSPRDS